MGFLTSLTSTILKLFINNSSRQTIKRVVVVRNSRSENAVSNFNSSASHPKLALAVQTARQLVTLVSARLHLRSHLKDSVYHPSPLLYTHFAIILLLRVALFRDQTLLSPPLSCLIRVLRSLYFPPCRQSRSIFPRLITPADSVRIIAAIYQNIFYNRGGNFPEPASRRIVGSRHCNFNKKSDPCQVSGSAISSEHTAAACARRMRGWGLYAKQAKEEEVGSLMKRTHKPGALIRPNQCQLIPRQLRKGGRESATHINFFPTSGCELIDLSALCGRKADKWEDAVMMGVFFLQFKIALMSSHTMGLSSPAKLLKMIKKNGSR